MSRRAAALLLLRGAAAAGPCEPATCKWLRDLYTRTNGQYWTKTWPVDDEKKDPCDYSGVVCNTKNGALQDIHLDHRNLTGELPDPGDMCVGNGDGARRWNYVHLHGNNLRGTIPSGFEKCGVQDGGKNGLQRLFLGGNQFSGTLPEWLNVKAMPHLFYVNVEGNRLTGTIPAGFATLTGATNPDSDAPNQFYLGENPWTCPIPDAVMGMKGLKSKPTCGGPAPPPQPPAPAPPAPPAPTPPPGPGPTPAPPSSCPTAVRDGVVFEDKPSNAFAAGSCADCCAACAGSKDCAAWSYYPPWGDKKSCRVFGVAPAKEGKKTKGCSALRAGA